MCVYVDVMCMCDDVMQVRHASNNNHNSNTHFLSACVCACACCGGERRRERREARVTEKHVIKQCRDTEEM
jgi:hypothetical protein